MSIILATGLAIAGCNSAPDQPLGIYTCQHGLFHETDDPDLTQTFFGRYDPDARPNAIAEECFEHGYRIAQAEMACAIGAQFGPEGDANRGGTYTVYFTEDGGETYEVDLRDHLYLGTSSDGDSLSGFAYQPWLEGFFCIGVFDDLR